MSDNDQPAAVFVLLPSVVISVGAAFFWLMRN
jgi:hypothetical protein